MKKILAIAFAALLVLGFAASAFAIHAEIPAETQSVVAQGSTQITLGGELRLRGWYRNNISYSGQKVHDKTVAGGLGVETPSQAWYDFRVRLSLEAKVTPNLIGFVMLETEGDGFDPTNDKYTFGQGNGNSGFGNAKPASDPDFLQAWILYQGSGLFGFNSGIKVGHMPLALGHKQFFDHTQMGDDALVFFMDPTKDIHIGLLTIKLAETTGNARFDNTNDLDAYVALMTYKYKTHKFGINYTYINMSDGFAVPPVGVENHTGIKLSNVGLHAEGTIGNFGYAAEGDIQFGHQDTYVDEDGDKDLKDKYRGWALWLKANYKINTVNLRGMFAYGSGDNDASDNKIKEFVPFVGSVQNYSFIYEYQHNTTAANVSGMNSPAPANGHAAGIANTTVYNLGVDWQAMKDLGLSLDGYIFRASKVGFFEDYTGDSVSKSAGWEVDFKGKYMVAKNLSYQVDFGYFKPGGFYEDVYGIDKKGVTALRHTLTLSF
ncbi:MAG: alginate export family protein [Thermodesulfovibrionales bacterium]